MDIENQCQQRCFANILKNMGKEHVLYLAKIKLHNIKGYLILFQQLNKVNKDKTQERYEFCLNSSIISIFVRFIYF